MKIIQKRPNEESEAVLVGYLHDTSPEMPKRDLRPCVVVCPGGGYAFLSDREKDPPALAFFAQGYNVFILSYSIKEKAKNLLPLMDISKALIMIRENHEGWNVIPNQIAVLGFSAGGHLAASVGTLWDAPELKERMDTKNGKNRPDAMILSYAVLNAETFAHMDSITQLVKDREDLEKKLIFSLDKQITSKTAPAFLWHTVEDDTVPVENSLLFASALQENKIPFELHIFPNGGHGLSMCNREVDSNNIQCSAWFPLAVKWLNSLFDFKY